MVAPVAAIAYVIWQGAVRVVGSKLAKELIKAGGKKLTKANFKKTYEFFKGNKTLKLSDKNKILEKLKIKPLKFDTKAAEAGAKLVKDITKPGKLKKLLAPIVESKVRKVLLPNPLKHPVHAAAVGGAVYGVHGMHKRSKEEDEKEEAAIKAKKKQESEVIEFKEKTKIEKKAQLEGVTMGEIDLNTIVNKEHTWKLDAQGDFVIP